ncbi:MULTISPECIES: RNA polymerase sigma factor [unclassified Streptomyces]|uniref:RNA polymerase sigma factor n=1 Tax=unclassified Streptomyces TaxID=2593676 RepID=UPI002030EA70|nr:MULTISPECIES: RNA polymerase sigma factor [unclassified Streptomyces]MCM1966360.1 RNA polymerase sigma factor [Streptomyces sp. G1]MCX5127068.1 RNA polymerase sigma factor [Streptomyces sp. NBC_00347]
MEADDAELGAAVERAQQGDEEAFALAYRMVHPRLLGYVRGLVGGEAEDVTAETWLEIARDLGRFRGDGAGFRGWTATIARHRALDHLRRQKRRPQTSPLEQDVLELPGALDTAATALEGLGAQAVLSAIRKLPRDQAESVLLRVIVGLDGPAAARVLGKRPGAVRSAAHRGLRKLAEMMSPGGADGMADNDSGARTLPARKVEGGR